MPELTEFEKGQIVGTRMAGASVTKAAELLGFSRATISRNSRSTEKPPATRVISAEPPNLPTEAELH